MKRLRVGARATVHSNAGLLPGGVEVGCDSALSLQSLLILCPPRPIRYPSEEPSYGDPEPASVGVNAA